MRRGWMRKTPEPPRRASKIFEYVYRALFLKFIIKGPKLEKETEGI